MSSSIIETKCTLLIYSIAAARLDTLTSSGLTIQQQENEIGELLEGFQKGPGFLSVEDVRNYMDGIVKTLVDSRTEPVTAADIVAIVLKGAHETVPRTGAEALQEASPNEHAMLQQAAARITNMQQYTDADYQEIAQQMVAGKTVCPSRMTNSKGLDLIQINDSGGKKSFVISVGELQLSSGQQDESTEKDLNAAQLARSLSSVVGTTAETETELKDFTPRK